MWKLAEDTLSDEDIDALADWLREHHQLTQGQQVRAFERAWASWLGVADAVFVSSGTTANFALLAVAGRRVSGRRPRTGVAAVTWSTNVTPALMLGHEVSIFDIDPSTLGVDAAAVCAAMDRGELDILFVTHLLGFNALDEEIVAAAHRNGVILLEDCCEAHGARMGDAKAGSIGSGSSFSFYFGHHMSTIEGGMIATDDLGLADELRLMRAHGLARESAHYDDLAAQHPEIDPRFLFVQSGLNFRSTELNAFLGLRQLRLLDDRIAQRNRNLDALLETAPPWLRTEYRTDGVSSFALPLIGTDARAVATIRSTTDSMGIESRPVVAGNLARQPFIREHDVRLVGPLSNADEVHRFGVYVGNGHHVTTDMVHQLTRGLAEAGSDR